MELGVLKIYLDFNFQNLHKIVMTVLDQFLGQGYQHLFIRICLEHLQLNLSYIDPKNSIVL